MWFVMAVLCIFAQNNATIMKKIYGFILSAAMILGSALFASSCQKEGEKQDILLGAEAWEGHLPIYDDADCYSRFTFREDGTGAEEVLVNGRPTGTYPFTWGWCNGYNSLLELYYGAGRYGDDISYLYVSSINERVLYGYFYKTWEIYQNFSYDESLHVTLRASGTHRH